MDIYHVWCDLRVGIDGLEFAAAVEAYLNRLRADSGLATYRLTRRKLGFGPDGLGEFHIAMEFASLTELDATFGVVAAREDPVESLHRAVFTKVENFRAALYRDFPDRL